MSTSKTSEIPVITITKQSSDSLTEYIEKVNKSTEILNQNIREALATQGLDLSEALLDELTQDAKNLLSRSVSESISYEISEGALLLPKSNVDILHQIQAGHFVLLPCYDSITENYFDFHRVTNCYEIFNKQGVKVFEIGSLVGNHQVTTNPNREGRHVTLPDFYKYSQNFTPGALVIQMAVTKILREESEKIPLILATSRAKASTKALREAGFRMIDWRKYPMIGATTCDPSCVGVCWTGCSADGVACHAKGELTRSDMCKLFVHESFTDEMLKDAEGTLSQNEINPLTLRINSKLPLTKE